MSYLFRIMLIFCIVILFSIGIMLIDYGASLKCFFECKGLEFYLQSLVFERIEPRIAYHLGLLLVISTFLITTGVYVFDIAKEVENYGRYKRKY